ncbi:MAG: class I SAM-dependent methyltransferase [Deltaproteobacteria bacterium]|jgi:predicted O-methyltransferase YrrM|nr:class I SAM-dependent methyltransferase [Deltaproteobacteria bacterium]
MSFAESAFATPEQEKEKFQHWLEFISFVDQRLYYRDQSPASLQALYELAREFRPTVIVELGTFRGMSLRVWLAAAPAARVHAVDRSFRPLREYVDVIPCDLSRVNLIEADILRVEFATLWNQDDRVLFFVDAHDAPQAPIMAHALRNALPHLPEESLFVVDDIWHSPELADTGNERRLFEEHVLHGIDELLLFEAHYAPYHQGGSFFGFAEVKPLLRYVNKHGLELRFRPGAKHVSFVVRKNPPVSASFDEKTFAAQCGVVLHHPLATAGAQSPLGEKVLEKIRKLYAKGDMAAALQIALDFRGAQQGALGLDYAIAVLLLRLHDFAGAKKFLELEASRPEAHPNAQRLAHDVNEAFFPLHGSAIKARKKGLTIFAAPKAFTGETAVMQKNAIASWKLLAPRPDIVLFGDDAGIAEAAAELGVRHISRMRKNEYNTPLVHDLFLQAREESETELLAYVNADIILFGSFMAGVTRAAGAFESFFLVGGRWDYDQLGPVDFSEPDWEEGLRQRVFRQGKAHALTGMDYFVFRACKAWPRIPPFALGRFLWDTWLFLDAVSQGISVLDATAFVPVVHQNHGYEHHPGGAKGLYQGVERARNKRLVGEMPIIGVDAAPYRLDERGEIHAR